MSEMHSSVISALATLSLNQDNLTIGPMWIRLCLPSCCPRFESQARHPLFYHLQSNLCYICHVKRTKLNKKRPGLARYCYSLRLRSCLPKQCDHHFIKILLFLLIIKWNISVFTVTLALNNNRPYVTPLLCHPVQLTFRSFQGEEK